MANRLTSNKIKAFNAAIGHFVLEWAGLEVGIDLLVMITERVLASKKFPHEISKKLNLIESNATRLGFQPKELRDLRALLKEIRDLAQIRHDYIHGAIIGHAVAKSKLTVTLARLLQPPNSDRRKPAKVTEEQLEKFSNRFQQIGNKLLDLAEIANAANPTKKI